MNLGIAPLDPATAIGQFRLTIGDVSYVEVEPTAIAGYGDYSYFSDAEAAVFLLTGSGSIAAAAGWATLQLANDAAIHASTLSGTDDIKLAADKRAADLRLNAQIYFDQAAATAELIAGADSFFTFAPSLAPRSRHLW